MNAANVKRLSPAKRGFRFPLDYRSLTVAAL